jgi:SAM-dependent methyltransferase
LPRQLLGGRQNEVFGSRSARSTGQYDAGFFEHVSETSLPSARVIVPLVCELAPVCSVLDVGCGTGAWLSVFRDRGISDLTGVDGGFAPPESLLIDPGALVKRDLTAPFSLDRSFDLVMSLEVGEHLPESSSGDFVSSICAHGDLVLFSAAVPGQAGTNHVNLHWPSWWAKHFGDHGLLPFDVIRPQIWYDESVALWYRNNVIVFAGEGHREGLSEIERELRRPIDVIHPTRWEWKLGEQRMPLGLGEMVRDAPSALARSLGHRLRRT